MTVFSVWYEEDLHMSEVGRMTRRALLREQASPRLGNGRPSSSLKVYQTHPRSINFDIIHHNTSRTFQTYPSPPYTKLDIN